MSGSSKKFEIVRRGGKKNDAVACEEPLQITIEGHPIAVVMRTPNDDGDLVRGFLLTEGLLDDLEKVSRIDLEQKKNHALVFFQEEVVLDFEKLRRNLYSASSCGICGKASIEAIRNDYPPVEKGFFLKESILLELPRKLRAAQEVFESTGGLHAAALMNDCGEVLVLKEDVGRHNAIDKVIGAGSYEGVDFSQCVLQLSGRVSFEVMQKALAVGIPMVAAISAPTSLAVEFGRESGQTLVGFLRPPDYNIYAGEERIKD